MKVRVIAMLVLLGSIFTLPARMVAQEATPAASPVAEAQLGDLPALMMTVADLEAAGQHNSKLSSGDIKFTPTGYVSAFGFDPDTTTAVSETLATGGFLGTHTIWWQILDPQSGEPIREIMTYLERYASPEGAAAGFAALEAASVAANPTTQVFVDDQTIGDRLQIIGVGGQAASGTPGAGTPATDADATVWHNVLVQTGPFNAGITVTDYTGQVPTVAELEALAAAFLARIEVEQEREAPGMALHALRLNPSDISFAGYESRDGTTPQFANETEASWHQRTANLSSAVTVYRSDGFVPFGAEVFDDDILVSNRVIRFPDDHTAAAFIADVAGLLQRDDATVRERDLELGDETLVADAEETSATGEELHRAWVFIRDGADVTRVYVEQRDVAPALTGVEALAAAALDCLDATDWCPAVRVPTELMTAATPVASAAGTPVPSSVGTPMASSAHASCAERVAQDQAAVTLTPGDLRDAGLNDFGFSNSRYFTAESDITYFANALDRDVEDIRALLTDAGHRGSYGLQLVWPAGEEPAPSTWPAAVTTAVYAFADAAGAREGFALLTGDYPAEPADEMSLSAPIGDASTLTRSRAEQASPTAGASQKLTLRFLRDCVVVELTVGSNDLERAELLTPATIEALGQRLVERVDNVLAGQSPCLDGRLLRVQTGTDAESSVVYGKLGGETVRTWRESDQAFLQRVLRSVAFNSLLERAVTFTAGTDEAGDDLLLTTTLLRFPDEKRASAWVRDTIVNYEAAPSFSDVAELPELPQFGDESLAVTLTNTTGVRSYAGDTILVRVDDVVAYIYLQQPSGNSDRQRSVATLAELAAAQAACLEQSGLCASMPVPEGLAPPVATPVS